MSTQVQEYFSSTLAIGNSS